ncbi:HK97 family phage prohead protease [bacterium]|nr:HK97 family phage prohead protease [bacterium]
MESEEQQEWRFEGLAASTRIDRQHERLGHRALESMVRRLRGETEGGSAHRGGGRRPALTLGHQGRDRTVLGVVEESWVDEEGLHVRGRLDRGHAEAKSVYENLRHGGEYGLSVGGRVTAAHRVYDESAGEVIRVIDDVTLDHVAVCKPEQAANPATYLRALEKEGEAVEAEDEPESREATEGAGEEANASGATRGGKLGGLLQELRRVLGRGGPRAQETEPAEPGPSDEADPPGDLWDEMEALAQKLEALGGQVEALEKAIAEGEPSGETMEGTALRRDRSLRRSFEAQQRTDVEYGPKGHQGAQLWKGVL